LGDDAGNKLLGIKLDPYRIIFRIARVHVLVPVDRPLSRESLVEALRSERSYIAFDSIADPEGFSFSISDATGNAGERRLRAVAPLDCRLVLIRNGEKISETSGKETVVDVLQAGAYRVEAYLDQLGSPFDKVPWIISNPIYVR
jgi:hypothetical protein